VLADAGTITITEALGRAELPEEYRARIASGELTLDEAAALWRQATRVHDDAVARMVGDIRSFLSASDTAVKVQDHDWRDEVLGELHKHERDRFLEIEKGALLDAVVG
jgi:hypothetical protein